MKKLLYVCILLISMLALAACGDSDKSSDKKEEKKTDQAKTDKTWEKVKESGELVVGTSGTLFPASYYPEDSKELTGYDVEIMREVAKRLDVKAKFEIMGFDSMLSALSTGRVDTIQAGPRKDSKDKFLFSDPYKYSYTTMIVRKDDNSGIEKLEDLKGKKAGGAATTIYSAIAEHYGAEVVTYGNVTNDAYLRDVENGRTDTIINDYYLQAYTLKAYPEFNIHLHPTIKMNPTTQNIVVDKNATELNAKMNQALKDMAEDGTIAKISGEFFDGVDVSLKPKEEIIDIEGIEK